MGLLSWFKRSKPETKPANAKQTETPVSSQQLNKEVPGLNGAVEVPRPEEKLTVFEFGSVYNTGDKVTLAGYCPVSEDFEPCRWAILPAEDSYGPQFRVVF